MKQYVACILATALAAAAVTNGEENNFDGVNNDDLSPEIPQESLLSTDPQSKPKYIPPKGRYPTSKQPKPKYIPPKGRYPVSYGGAGCKGKACKVMEKRISAQMVRLLKRRVPKLLRKYLNYLGKRSRTLKKLKNALYSDWTFPGERNPYRGRYPTNKYPKKNKYPTKNKYPKKKKYPTSKYPKKNKYPTKNKYTKKKKYPTSKYPKKRKYPTKNKYPTSKYPKKNKYPTKKKYPTSKYPKKNKYPPKKKYPTSKYPKKNKYPTKKKYPISKYPKKNKYHTKKKYPTKKYQSPTKYKNRPKKYGTYVGNGKRIKIGKKCLKVLRKLQKRVPHILKKYFMRMRARSKKQNGKQVLVGQLSDEMSGLAMDSPLEGDNQDFVESTDGIKDDESASDENDMLTDMQDPLSDM